MPGKIWTGRRTKSRKHLLVRRNRRCSGAVYQEQTMRTNQLCQDLLANYASQLAALGWIDATPQTEGITNGVAHIAAHPALLKTDNGFITVEGVDEGTQVAVYTPDGKQAGSAVSRNGAALVGTSIQPGNTAIVKIGNKTVKVIVR